jgi:predicted lactoylglutathione lyase
VSVNHLRLTVSDIASAQAFYDPLMRSLGYTSEPRDDGGLTAGAEILDPPGEYDDEPDHYAVFFRDPDGFKLEVVHVASGGS